MLSTSSERQQSNRCHNPDPRSEITLDYVDVTPSTSPCTNSFVLVSKLWLWIPQSRHFLHMFNLADPVGGIPKTSEWDMNFFQISGDFFFGNQFRSPKFEFWGLLQDQTPFKNAGTGKVTILTSLSIRFILFCWIRSCLQKSWNSIKKYLKPLTSIPE